MPWRRSRLRVTGVVLATLLLLALAQPPSSANGQLLSPALAAAAPRSGIALPPAEVSMVLGVARTGESPIDAGSAREATRDEHHSTVAGIPTPLAVPVGAIILVLVVLVAITVLTRGRHNDDSDDRTFLSPET